MDGAAIQGCDRLLALAKGIPWGGQPSGAIECGAAKLSLVTVPPTGQAWIFRLVALPCPFRYLIAAFLVGIALAIRLAVAAPDAGLPFLTFFPATVFRAQLLRWNRWFRHRLHGEQDVACSP